MSQTICPSPFVLPDAQTLRARVREWRATRRRDREPMPEELWAHAVELARQHGVSPVARAVGIDYTSLKRRLERSVQPSQVRGTQMVRRSAEAEPAAGAHGFVELDASALVTGPRGAQVEFERPDGCRIRVSLPAGTAPDWMGLATSLFGGRP